MDSRDKPKNDGFGFSGFGISGVGFPNCFSKFGSLTWLSGLWLLSSGIWHLAFGFRRLAFGFCFQALAFLSFALQVWLSGFSVSVYGFPGFRPAGIQLTGFDLAGFCSGVGFVTDGKALMPLSEPCIVLRQSDDKKIAEPAISIVTLGLVPRVHGIKTSTLKSRGQ